MSLAEKEELCKGDIAPSVLPLLAPAKHHLETPWCFWTINPSGKKEWSEELVHVCDFATVEDFWILVDALKPPSANGTPDYYFFRKVAITLMEKRAQGIRPMWEDEKNREGGRWRVTMGVSQSWGVDACWMELLMAMIGEQFGSAYMSVHGAAVSRKGQTGKLSLWTSDAKDDETNLHIGQVMKSKLKMPEGARIFYEEHASASMRTTSTVKARLSV